MRGILQRSLAFAIVLISMCAATLAGVPSVIQYQGILTDGTGSPVTVTVNVVFSIYDSEDAGAAGGPALWSETRSITPDATGQFNVLLGEVDPIADTVFSDPNRWVGIQVGADDEISPRTRLASVPFGFRVATIDNASGGDIYGDLTLHSTFSVGDFVGDTGRIDLFNGSTVTLSAEGAAGTSGGSRLVFRDAGGDTTMNLDGDWTGAGLLTVNDANGLRAAQLDGLVGRMVLDDPSSASSMILSSDAAGTDESQIAMWDSNNNKTVELTSNGGPGGAMLRLNDGSALAVQIKSHTFPDGGGEIDLFNSAGVPTIVIDANSDAEAGLIQVTSGAPGGIVAINGDGTMSVGGTYIPSGYSVAVAGKIICTEVEVQLQSDWPDYVFEANYPLMSLAEIENEISENGHLPGIPSAQEVATGGIGLGEMQANLLLKIEELTLHMIEMKKELDHVTAEKEDLKSRLVALESERRSDGGR